MKRAKIVLYYTQLKAMLGLPDNVDIVSAHIDADPLALQVIITSPSLPERLDRSYDTLNNHTHGFEGNQENHILLPEEIQDLINKSIEPPLKVKNTDPTAE